MQESKAQMAGKYRILGPLPRTIAVVFTTVAIGAALIYIFNFLVFGRSFVEYGYFNLLQAMLLPLAFLYLSAVPQHRDRLPWYDIILACLAFAIPFTFFINAFDIAFKAWEIMPPTWAFIMALIYWPLILEAARRAGGWFFSIFLLAVSVYPLVSHYAPGIFQSAPVSLQRTVAFHILSTNSVNGLVMGVIGTLFIGFLLFGDILVASGAGKAFLAIAMATCGRLRGGAAKASIVSSAFTAMLSGSAVSNVLITGPITIPAMVKTGYHPKVAAAVETCASSGGVLMPPVMGAVAFIMASLLDIRYALVCLAAIVPSLLYYYSLFAQVDFSAAKEGIKGLPESEIPQLGKAVLEILPYIVSIGILIWLLLFLRREAQAPFFASAYLLVIAMLRKQTRFGAEGFINLVESTGKLLAELIAIVLSIGFVLGSVLLTGTAQVLTSGILDLAGGNVYILVILGALTSFVLGMGLTVSATYLLLAILIAPTLIRGGLDPIAVHLFLVYTGTLSYITPPVALAAFAAASLAGTHPMETGWRAVRLGLVLFIIPFLFVLNPAFVLHGTPLEIIHALGTGFLGVTLLAAGAEGYFIGIGRLNLASRSIAFASGVMVFLQLWTLQIIGVALIIGFILTKLTIRRTSDIKQ